MQNSRITKANAQRSTYEYITQHKPESVVVGLAGFHGYIAYLFPEKELALLEYVQSYADRSTMKYYADLYHKVSKNRNAIAHSIKDGSGSVVNTVKNMIRDLDTFIQQYKDKL